MGAKSPNLADRRVQRTRRTLREALISLLCERGWDVVSVQDICERADVGRSTFYMHFADKEELLIDGFSELRQMLRAQRSSDSKPPRQPLQFARRLIEHAHENQRLFRALVGKRSGQVVLHRFRELVVELVREDLVAAGASGAAREPAVRFLSGAFLELLTWSLDARGAPDPEALERSFRAMAASGLAHARK